MSETINGKFKITKQVYKNNDYFIFGASPIQPFSDKLKLNKYFCITLKGELGYLSEGKEYELEIEELATDNYGTSYKVISCPSLSNFDVSALSLEEKKEILMDCTTSERIADNILEAYPNFIELILTQGKEAIDVKKVKGMGEAYLSSYSRNLLEKYKYLGIINHFKDYKLDVSDCKQLISEYTDEETIAKEIKNNPYKVLISVLHRSFEFADRMIMEIRPDLKVSEMRCAYLILSVLEKNEQEGDTRLNGNDLYYYIMEEYNVPELEPLIVPTAMNNDLFYYDEKTKDLSIMATYIAECKIADLVISKNENPHKLNIDYTKYKNIDGFELTDEQLGLLNHFCNYDCMILSGVSGGGKTSSIKALVQLMEDNGLTYTLLTPTGASALRVTEQTHRPASTIHRKVLRDGEIDTDVIVVDEMSMVGLDVFSMLINAITNENCKLVLAGDDSQIPSIQKGRVFSDLIQSKKLPITFLHIVFRYNSSGGSFVGENIRNGRRFLDNEKVVHRNNIYTIFGNYKFIETENIFDETIKEYAELRKKYKENEIIILSCYNKGECGTYKLNEAIENEYNPPKPNEKILSYKRDSVNIIFRVGSRVVNTKNDYKAMPLESYKEIQSSEGLLTSEDVLLTQLFNGQIGTVREVQDNYLVCQFDEQLIVIEKNKLNTLLLARAISTHRSQGGEWKAVINIISPLHTRLLSKNLLYVSDTRGKEYHCDIGDKKTFEDSLLVDVVKERNTWLKELTIERSDKYELNKE